MRNTAHLDHPRKYLAALAGRLPAEALSGNDREALMVELVGLNFTDRAIERRTGWTLYTVQRIRERLCLAPNFDAQHDQNITERVA
ncbi:hypothetical protein ACWEQ4_01505 [Rhodococcus sp. NPDC003994]